MREEPIMRSGMIFMAPTDMAGVPWARVPLPMREEPIMPGKEMQSISSNTLAAWHLRKPSHYVGPFLR